MYKHIQDGKVPEWTKGIASINSEHYKKSGISEKEIIEENVEAITFDKLIKDYSIAFLDLLQIDTEGYDYSILKMFPFNILKPKIIHFEHDMKNGLMTKEQLLEICALLINNGFKLIIKDHDCIAHK